MSVSVSVVLLGAVGSCWRRRGPTWAPEEPFCHLLVCRAEHDLRGATMRRDEVGDEEHLTSDDGVAFVDALLEFEQQCTSPLKPRDDDPEPVD